MCYRIILFKSLTTVGGYMTVDFRKSVEIIKGFSVSLTSLDGSSVLKNCNFNFKEGDVFKLKGKLGHCSEFLKMLGFLEVNYSGQVFVNENNVQDMSFEEFQGYRLNIGYSFDFGGLLNNRTIRENILLPLQYHNEISNEEAEDLVDSYINKFSLEEFGDLRPAMTPGYVRKLACVIRSLVLKPEVLVMDGPTTAIDHGRSKILVSLIKEKLENKEIKILLFSSTYEEGFSEWSPKTLEIKDGGLIGLDNGDVAA